MRILTLASEAAPIRSGVARSVERIAAGFRLAGHSVEIRSYADAPTFRGDRVRLSTLGLRVARRSLSEFDLVHLHGPTPTVSDVVLLRAAIARHRIPLLYTHHFSIAVGSRVVDPMLSLYNRFHRRLARCATVIVASTPTYAARLRSTDGPPVEVIPWGVDLPAQVGPRTLRSASDPLRVLVVGQFRAYKGHRVAIDAVAGRPELQLTLAGSGPMLDQLRRAAAAHDNIQLVEAPSDDQLSNLYREHEVVTLPSLTELEAFGIVLVEGMAHGCVPVAAALAGVADIAAATGRTFRPGDAGQLTDLLMDLHARPDTLLAAATASRERAGELTWETSSRAYVELVARFFGSAR